MHLVIPGGVVACFSVVRLVYKSATGACSTLSYGCDTMVDNERYWLSKQIILKPMVV